MTLFESSKLNIMHSGEGLFKEKIIFALNPGPNVNVHMIPKTVVLGLIGLYIYNKK